MIAMSVVFGFLGRESADMMCHIRRFLSSLIRLKPDAPPAIPDRMCCAEMNRGWAGLCQGQLER